MKAEGQFPRISVGGQGERGPVAQSGEGIRLRSPVLLCNNSNYFSKDTSY